MNDLITVDEAAKLLRLKKSTIYNKCHRRIIPYYKRGNLVLFDPKELEAWLRGGRVPTNEELRAKARANTNNQPIRHIF